MPALPDAAQESPTERALLVLPVAAGEAGSDIPSAHGRLFSRTLPGALNSANYSHPTAPLSPAPMVSFLKSKLCGSPP